MFSAKDTKLLVQEIMIDTMWNQLISIDKNSSRTLQLQIRQQISSAISNAYIAPKSIMPSSRKLSKILKVARNTIVLVYEKLEFDGYLTSIERKGYFVTSHISNQTIDSYCNIKKKSPKWCEELIIKKPCKKNSSLIPKDWKKLKYPFVSGQLDQSLVPVHKWREVVKISSSVQAIKKWNIDYVDADDPVLIQQIKENVLPKRGIWANTNQILLSAGTQNAIYMIADLLVNNKTTVGIENPGYPDVANIFRLKTKKISLTEVDENGVIVDSIDSKCNLVYTTPSHQYPSGVTMSMQRRKQLLQKAKNDNFVIIEDDYEVENNFTKNPSPSLKSMDKNAQVIYVGSFSKTFSPGLRLGYIVAPEKFIQELRALRRLMMRHMPTNNQRAMALFISLGYYHNMLDKIHSTYKQRWGIIAKFINEQAALECTTTFGGSSFWIKLEKLIDSEKLRIRLLNKGVAIQSGNMLFFQDPPVKNYIRMGCSSIKTNQIIKGLRLIVDEIELMR